MDITPLEELLPSWPAMPTPWSCPAPVTQLKMLLGASAAWAAVEPTSQATGFIQQEQGAGSLWPSWWGEVPERQKTNKTNIPEISLDEELSGRKFSVVFCLSHVLFFFILMENYGIMAYMLGFILLTSCILTVVSQLSALLGSDEFVGPLRLQHCL